MYTLKKNQEAFVVVAGPFKGKKFERGKEYSEIPPQEKHRFDIVRPAEEPKKKGPEPRADAVKAMKAEEVKNNEKL